MNILRFFLFPFAIIYWMITSIRNFLYDVKFFKVNEFEIPIICVGNLNTGGTGKTPHVEFLIELLKNKYNLAVLSRGYKRKTSGFILANERLGTHDIGDEPMQYFKKFPEIIVAVDEKRARGIKNLLNLNNPPNLILLDDAYQHRSVKPKISILLSDFNKPFFKDYILPVGNLRECRSAYKRAEIIVFTKVLSRDDILFFPKKILNSAKQKIFFSSIKYEHLLGINNCAVLKEYTSKNTSVLILTGIANPTPLKNHIKLNFNEVISMNFPDHHIFNSGDISKVVEAFKNINSSDKIIITTEKDATRLNKFLQKELNDIPVFVQPISISFLNNENIDFVQHLFELI